MENFQSVQPASTNNDLLTKAAELAYLDFVKQITKPTSKGFISEGENGKKIFSFETYLRESGRSEDLIQHYCNHIKTSNYAMTAASKGVIFSFKMNNIWGVLAVIFLAMIPGILLYLLIAAFLWTFTISFWNWLPFSLFALCGPFLLLVQYVKTKQTFKTGN